jgi:DNA-binding NtrC family response regulator
MKEKILIMDDEPLVLSAMERSLLKVGYTVKAVSTPAKYKKALGEESFDLAILDLHIPDSSIEKLEDEARGKNPRIKFIHVSGANERGEGGNFLQKPFRIDDLRKLVRSTLDNP